MKKALIVINPMAGTRQANRYFVQITDIICKAGYEVSVATTQGRGDATDIVRERGEGNDLLVCIGGDGTLDEVIDGLLIGGIKVPVGYIPAGSTNDFGTSLGLPKGILSAARNIVEGEPVPLDVGKFNDRHFSYVASFGAFTQTSYSAPQSLKNTLGHLAYVMEGIKDLSQLKPFSLRLKNQLGVYGGEYIFGAICNSTSIGGILTLSKDVVDMNDGLFEVLLIRYPRNIIEAAQAINALNTQNFRSSPLISFFSSSRVEIKADKEMPWALDGEYQEGQEYIEVKNIQSAIEIIVPKSNKEIYG